MNLHHQQRKLPDSTLLNRERYNNQNTTIPKQNTSFVVPVSFGRHSNHIDNPYNNNVMRTSVQPPQSSYQPIRSYAPLRTNKNSSVIQTRSPIRLPNLQQTSKSPSEIRADITIPLPSNYVKIVPSEPAPKPNVPFENGNIQVNCTATHPNGDIQDLGTMSAVCASNASRRNEEIRKIAKSVWKHIDGALWGAANGLCTGALTGATVNNNSGGWIAGAISCAAGVLYGSACGLIGGAVMGALSDRESINDIWKGYRDRFGIVPTTNTNDRMSL